MSRLIAASALLLVSACSGGAQDARTIPVALKGTRFVPDTFTLAAGERVTFEIDNVDVIQHEFVIGTAEEQEEHERRLASGAGHQHGSAAGAGITVDAEDSATFDYTAPDTPQTLQLVCHVDNHDEAGMVGTVTVT